MSVEFYCSALVLLLIMLTRRTPNFGIIICSSFFVCSVLLSIFLDQRLASFSPTKSQLDSDIRELNSVHKTPWIFIGPIIIGKLTGELCFSKCSPKISKTLIIIGWILACLILAIIVSGRIAFGYFDDFKSLNEGFEGLSRSLFCVVAAWFVINKVTSEVLWRWARPLSKLSSICLLVHPLVLRLFVIKMGSNTLPSPSIIVIGVVHFGLISVSLMASSILYLVYEAPLNVFKKRYVQKFILRQN